MNDFWLQKMAANHSKNKIALPPNPINPPTHNTPLQFNFLNYKKYPISKLINPKKNNEQTNILLYNRWF